MLYYLTFKGIIPYIYGYEKTYVNFSYNKAGRLSQKKSPYGQEIADEVRSSPRMIVGRFASKEEIHDVYDTKK
ncbi:hypothetical protein GCM10011571_12100 [Marinithermofilum abyssi]|uniref:Uncharacterized protein n=1 Tax=Marinithermofilum abyssi TaxID=1571185 RepID=A0A8J2VDJ7_9BACL|nr:hypothetical protein GCM10011571_12100 [Marinithermofilum abyssi]